MRFDTWTAYKLADPDHNRHFIRPALQRAYSADDLDRLGDEELARGNVDSADRLFWRAAALRAAL